MKTPNDKTRQDVALPEKSDSLIPCLFLYFFRCTHVEEICSSGKGKLTCDQDSKLSRTRKTREIKQTFPRFFSLYFFFARTRRTDGKLKQTRPAMQAISIEFSRAGMGIIEVK